MTKAFWVTIYREITDPDRLVAYARLAPAAIAPFGGRYLVRGLPTEIFEAGLRERVVISEFPNAKAAIAAYNCPAYQDALRVLGDAAVRDIRIVDVLEEVGSPQDSSASNRG